MKTKYAVGDIVKVGAKIEKIEIDEKGVKYRLSSSFWKGFKEVREGDLSPGSPKPAPKTSEKMEKTSAKTEKASKNGEKRQKTAKNGKELQKTEENEEKQQGSTEGAKVGERQQERKRPGRPSKKAVGESEDTTAAAGLKEFAKELAEAEE